MGLQRTSKQDTQVIQGSQVCTRCKQAKSLDQFGVIRSQGRAVRPRYWCRDCERIDGRHRDETPARKAWLKAWRETHLTRLETWQRDTQVTEGSQLCTHCKRVKPLDQFGTARCRGRKTRLRSWCRACDRISERLRDETPARKAWLKAYRARADVQRRRRESDRRYQAVPAHAEKAAARKLKYSRSPRGKLMQCRSRAVKRLEGAAGEKRAQVLAVIEACDRELERTGV